MDTLVKSQQVEEEDLTVPEALVDDKRNYKMGLLNLCVIFTYYFCYVIFMLLF